MKKYFTRKRLQWKLLQQSCKPTDCNFTKNGALVRPLWKSTESSNVIGGKPLWWRLEFTPPFNFERAPPQRYNYIGFKVSENFLQNIVAVHFLTIFRSPIKKAALTKLYGTNFQH